MNNLGQVAGYYCQCVCGEGDEAFFWDGSNFITLARPAGFRAARAYGMNDQQWVVGSMTQTNIDLNHAVLWQNGVPIDLRVPPTGNFSEGRSLNSSGQVVGYWGNTVTGDPGLAAFLWADGNMATLELPVGPNAQALDINTRGDVVGWMGSSIGTDAHAFMWQDGAVTDLGVIAGGFTSSASAVNDSAQVVGSGRVPQGGFPSGVTRAFLWQDGEMMQLGVLPDHILSAAFDINAAGRIVGQSWYVDGSPNISHAFLWDGGVMTNLDDLIPRELSLNITIAYAINQQGRIAGQANGADGVVGVLLTPIGASSADVNVDGAVNVLDLIELLLCFGQPAAPDCQAADVNDDGTVDVLDLIEVLLDFGTICT